ncbi:type IIL restriction-modification enzyme MmeI [Rubellimicrobium mesophilum]
MLQSDAHWQWFINRCSTLTERFRYTSNTVWDSFPWPQKPSQAAVEAVAKAAVALRAKRAELMTKHGRSLRDLYRSLELPGASPLKDAHAALDAAVRSAYGMPAKADTLEFLLKLNAEVAEAEAKGKAVQKPGLPEGTKDRSAFVTADAIGT